MTAHWRPSWSMTMPGRMVFALIFMAWTGLLDADFTRREGADPIRSSFWRQRRTGVRFGLGGGRIAMRAAGRIVHGTAAVGLRRDPGRADRDLAVSARYVEHVGRLAEPGDVAAQRPHQRLAFGDRRPEVDRKRVVLGKSVSVRVDLGGRSSIKKTKCERLVHHTYNSLFPFSSINTTNI